MQEKDCNDGQKAAILGAIAGAQHIHTLAEAYGATVILHTDHCAKKLLPWIDGLLDASEAFYKQTENLFILLICLTFLKSL
jgi:fructose-bisphosphate aldolase class II